MCYKIAAQEILPPNLPLNNLENNVDSCETLFSSEVGFKLLLKLYLFTKYDV